jgi:hypothetical protein
MANGALSLFTRIAFRLSPGRGKRVKAALGASGLSMLSCHFHQEVIRIEQTCAWVE